MTAPERALSARDADAAQAYHDGELSGFALWRFERRLRRSEALRRELHALALMGELVRESDPAVAEPDLWDGIALRLPAIDAERGEAAPPARAAWWQGLLRPLPAAVVATAAAALLLLLLQVGLPVGEPAKGGVVHYVNSDGRDVMVLGGDPDMTIIWVLEGGAESARTGGASGRV